MRRWPALERFSGCPRRNRKSKPQRGDPTWRAPSNKPTRLEAILQPQIRDGAQMGGADQFRVFGEDASCVARLWRRPFGQAGLNYFCRNVEREFAFLGI